MPKLWKKLYSIFGKWCDSRCQLSDKSFIAARNKSINWDELTQKTKTTKSEWSPTKRQQVKDKMIDTKMKKYGENFGKAIHEKVKKTCLEKYSVENVFQNEDIIKKCRQTCKTKYGDENFRNPSKAKQTIKERYGIENWMSSETFRELSKQTKLQKYGNENYLNANKAKETCLKHYGVDNWGKTKESIAITHTPEANRKRLETKRRNHTFNTSKTESESYKLLKERYPDVQRQYKSELYPFACDFYIPSLELYVECNYHWTHGGKPYEGTIEDNKKLQAWKSKDTKFYRNAINCWTRLDVIKRNTAKQNGLNYIEFFSILNLQQWIDNYDGTK